jgi:hypothetical protein
VSNIRVITDPRVIENLKAIFAPPVPARDPTWMEWDAIIAAAPDRNWRSYQAAAVEGWRRRRERQFGILS